MNDRVFLFNLHVPKQGDVGMFIASQGHYYDLIEGIFAPLLPAAHHPDGGRLEDALHQGRESRCTHP